MKSFWLAAAVGAVLGIISGGLVIGQYVVKKRAELVEGWNLVPVIVAAVDIAEGETVTFDMISQRSVPERFVTPSVVRPDSAASIVNRKSTAPAQAGDPLTWQHFVPRDLRARECTVKINAAVTAAGDAVIDAAAAKFGEGLTPPPALGAGTTPKGDVVVVTQAVSEGTVLTAAMLKASPYAEVLITASNVPAGQLGDLVGTRSMVPLQPGDAVMWQMLDSGARPGSMTSCVKAVVEAATAARELAAKQEVEKL